MAHTRACVMFHKSHYILAHVCSCFKRPSFHFVISPSSIRDGFGRHTHTVCHASCEAEECGAEFQFEVGSGGLLCRLPQPFPWMDFGFATPGSYPHAFIEKWTSIHSNMCTSHASIYTWTHTHLHMRMYMCIYICTHTYTRGDATTYICRCTHSVTSWYIYIYIYQCTSSLVFITVRYM